MSKIVEALKKVNQYRKAEPSEIGPQGSILESTSSYGVRSKRNPLFQNAMLIFVALMAVVSFIFNLRALTLINTVNISSSTVLKDIAWEKTRIESLETSLAAANTQQDSQIDNLKTKFNVITTSLKKDETKIGDLFETNNDLTTSLKDLKWSVKNLSDKYIAVKAELNNLSNANKEE